MQFALQPADTWEQLQVICNQDDWLEVKDGL